MRLFPPKDDMGKVYVDENRKIKWIWASLDKERIYTFLQETQLLKKIIYLALISGTLSGIILSFI